ncbi:2-dehydro-3-deoxygalactonokinase [Escherichia coli]|uniref:2-dehydro-3-deoxygalactonokinase n=1 Tax=Escherichia coli TaxID=562 RepID=A0A376TZ25_ECOLX|nr:2-dehydro-3-deoxygalactonokinase [Escherichia coli]
MTARYIAIDWGSTNLRAWLYQGDHCLESRQSEAGVTRLNGKSPAAVLAEVTTDWREENTPVVMAGMVGSNVGWKVAPYLSVPARFFVYWRTINVCWRQYLDYSRIMRLS